MYYKGNQIELENLLNEKIFEVVQCAYLSGVRRECKRKVRKVNVLVNELEISECRIFEKYGV